MSLSARPSAQNAESAKGYYSVSAWVAWGTVGVLLTMAVVAYLDRQIIALMVDPIRQDLRVSDFQIGLLQGVAFGLFYAAFGLPMGWLVDRIPRRIVIFVGIVVWSLATVACGLAGSFTALLLARFLVGAGEASLSPAAYSMVADLFPKRRLALALGVFGAGSSLGSAVAMALGGALLSHLGQVSSVEAPLVGALAPWQLMFLLIGAPGLMVALLAFAVPEPVRRKAATDSPDAVGGFLRFLVSRRRYFACHFLGFGLVAILAYATAAWAPVMLMRRFGMDVGAVGALVGAVGACSGIPGFLFSGWAADRWFAAGRKDAHLRYFMVATLVGVAAATLAFQVLDRLWLVIPLYALAHFLQPFTGPAAAHLQLVTPSQYRGRVSALFLLVFNLMGLCLGPTSVAFVTDYVFHDPAKVGSSLALVYVIAGLGAAGAFALGLAPARRAVETAQAW